MFDFESSLSHLLRMDSQLGLNQATYDALRRGRSQSSQPVSRATVEEVKELHLRAHWLASSCHLLPSPVNLVVFWVATEAGPLAAVRLLQSCLGVSVDGVVGSETLSVVTHTASYELASAMLDLVSFGRLPMSQGWEQRAQVVRSLL